MMEKSDGARRKKGLTKGFRQIYDACNLSIERSFVFRDTLDPCGEGNFRTGSLNSIQKIIGMHFLKNAWRVRAGHFSFFLLLGLTCSPYFAMYPIFALFTTTTRQRPGEKMV
jgi:hypothetical protein